MTATLDDTYWAAVQERDRAFDGTFVFAVRTTGIYCRPSCAARRPSRANVTFYAAPGDAAAAGFRACRRCDPNAVETAADRAVASARGWLEAHAGEPVTLAELARVAGVSAHHLQRIFKRATGVSPAEYAAALRAEAFRAHLRSADSVSRAAYDAGFGASSRAYEAAARRLGMTPATYRRGGRGATIRYMTADTPLGRVLVAATERGVCAVTLGDDDAALEHALAGEFPHAQRVRIAAEGGTSRADSDLREWLRSVAAALSRPGESPSVELDLAGTPFQRRVWAELRRIPPGETRSYTELAAAVGRPGAVRAVASACARNPAAIVVPCHRVVRSDGARGEYRWGRERKARLLDRELAVAVRRV